MFRSFIRRCHAVSLRILSGLWYHMSHGLLTFGSDELHRRRELLLQRQPMYKKSKMLSTLLRMLQSMHESIKDAATTNALDCNNRFSTVYQFFVTQDKSESLCVRIRVVLGIPIFNSLFLSTEYFLD